MLKQFHVLMDKAGDGQGGGGGGGQGDGNQQQNQNQNQQQQQNNQQQADPRDKEIADLKARLATFEGNNQQQQNQNDQDLNEKARQQRDARDKNDNDSKALEAAIRFNVGAQDWLKNNQTVLPKDIGDIFEAAEKEQYGSAIEKDRDIKAGIIKSFFSVQANVDLLTPAIKNQLEDYLKLTQNGRKEKAQAIYDTIFEPAFEMLKRVKKAEAIQRGHGDGSDDSYKARLMGYSQKHYLGEKTNA